MRTDAQEGKYNKCIKIGGGGGRICSAKKVQHHVLYPDTLQKAATEERTEVFAVIDKNAVNTTAENFLLSSGESLVVQTQDDFELALVLKKKEKSRSFLLEMIKSRIEEKREILRGGMRDSVCLVGHSQLDDWDIREMCGMPVRNCGIRGISSFQYRELILDPEILDGTSEAFVVMQGTNDIVYDYSLDEIVESIKKMLFYIRERNPDAIICVVACLHVNGRADRSNRKIDRLNGALCDAIRETDAFWVGMGEMDDSFGNLRREYTCDGLHLSSEGYTVFGRVLENGIRRAFRAEDCGDSGAFRVKGIKG